MNNNPLPAPPLPPEDLRRPLVQVNADGALPHIGLVGDTYTVLLSGADTQGRYCLIDMHIPPGGGPPPHRHDFEESFTVLEGEIEAVFRGQKATVRGGDTIQIPANAPHSFKNVSARPARLLCICAPAGQEEFFRAVGVSVGGRTTPPSPPTPAEQASLMAKMVPLLVQYRTEMVPP